jgi:DMSO reductase family type II enzyme heme b subunit
MHNGGWIAFLIEWKDTTLSDRVVLDNLGDQVAVELPVDIKADPPSPMMGNPGGRVNIMQWRAAFQHDLTTAALVRGLYPTRGPTSIDSAGGRRRPALLGRAGIENDLPRPAPVLDQMAEGWGTMTVKPDQHALGKGAWKNGVWRVVITRPMVSDDLNAPRLLPRTMTRSRWDGASRGRRAQIVDLWCRS